MQLSTVWGIKVASNNFLLFYVCRTALFDLEIRRFLANLAVNTTMGSGIVAGYITKAKVIRSEKSDALK